MRVGSMSGDEATKLVKKLETEQRHILRELKSARDLEVKTKRELERCNVEFGRLEDDMARLHRSKAYGLLTGSEWEEVSGDPRDPEGNPSQDWGELFVERMLRNDLEWQETIASFYDKQTELSELNGIALSAQSDVIRIQETLMSKNAEFRLRAAFFSASHIVEVNIGAETPAK